MTTGHVDPEALAAFADGTLSAEAVDSVRTHVADCRACQLKIDDVRRLEELVSQSNQSAEGVLGGHDIAVPKPLDLAFDRVIKTHVTGRPGRFRSLRSLALGVAATAAAIVLWVVLRPETTPAGPAFEGRLVAEAAAGDLRGAADGTFHFEFSVSRSTYIAIFELSATNVELVYPHPNPVFGVFGHTTPFSAGEQARIPPSAVADWPKLAAQSASTFLAVPMAELPTGPGLAPVVTELRAALHAGPAAVRSHLRDRFGSVVELASRSR